jgi:hypothetical protein
VEKRSLEKELAIYRENLPTLLATDAGRWALVHGDAVDSIWDTYADALAAGYRFFGLDPFLVQQIQAREQVYFIGFR